MDTATLTGEIVERLTIYLPFVAVENFPDDPDNYYLTHPVGSLLVMYSGSDGEESRRAMKFEVTAVSRELLTATKLIEAARWVLCRWEPFFGATPFVCSDDEFVQVAAGTWYYAATFESSGPVVNVHEADLTTRINTFFNIT